VCVCLCVCVLLYVRKDCPVTNSFKRKNGGRQQVVLKLTRAGGPEHTDIPSLEKRVNDAELKGLRV
jgi:hypothetical protein